MSNRNNSPHRDRMVIQHRIRELQTALAKGEVVEHNASYLSTQTVRELETDGFKLADPRTEGAQSQYLEDWRGNLREVYLVATKSKAEAQPIIVTPASQVAASKESAPAQSPKPATKPQPQPAAFQVQAPA